MRWQHRGAAKAQELEEVLGGRSLIIGQYVADDGFVADRLVAGGALLLGNDVRIDEGGNARRPGAGAVLGELALGVHFGAVTKNTKKCAHV